MEKTANKNAAMGVCWEIYVIAEPTQAQRFSLVLAVDLPPEENFLSFLRRDALVRHPFTECAANPFTSTTRRC